MRLQNNQFFRVPAFSLTFLNNLAVEDIGKKVLALMMITRTCNCATHRLNEGAGLTWPVRLLTTRPFSFFSLFLGSRFLYPSTCAPTLPRALKSKAI